MGSHPTDRSTLYTNLYDLVRVGLGIKWQKCVLIKYLQIRNNNRCDKYNIFDVMY